MSNLQELIFNKYSYLIFESIAFKHLICLRRFDLRLYLTGTSNVNSHIFNNLINLTELKLYVTSEESNTINSIDNPFSGLQNLKKFHFGQFITLTSSYEIKFLGPPDIFGSMSKLEELRIDLSFLSNISSKIFKS